MDDLMTARLIALGRVLYGAAMIVWPARLLAAFGSKDEPSGSTLLLGKIFGIRDVALGAGALVSLADPEPDNRWVVAGAAADTADAVVAATGTGLVGRGPAIFTTAFAGTVAAFGWKAAIGLRR